MWISRSPYQISLAKADKSLRFVVSSPPASIRNCEIIILFFCCLLNSAKETAQHSTKLISNKENVEAEAKDLNSVGKNIETSQSIQIQKLISEPEIVSLPSPVEVTTCMSLSQPSFSDSSEKLQILNQESEQSEKPEDVTSTIESETKSEIVTDVTALPEISTPLSLNKPQITFSEQNEDLSDQQGEVVYVNDPSSFYVQLLESCALLGEIGEKLNSLYCGKLSCFINMFYSNSC